MRSQGVLVGSSIGLFALLFSTIVFAQATQEFSMNIIRIEAGKMLEIGTDTAAEKPDYSWILAKDRKFQYAQRSRFFQTRFSQTGMYTLDISVQDAGSSQNEYNAFQIVVTDPELGNEPTSGSDVPLKAVLNTNPPAINGTVYLPIGGGILTLDGSASTSKIAQYALDLDGGIDSDSDGDPTNDFENLATFSAQTGSPLLYFIRQKGGSRNITLTVTDGATGKTDRVSVSIVFGSAPANTGNVQTTDPTSPIIMDISEGTVRFGLNLPENLRGGKQLLTEWNFGDGGRSLLEHPVHSYKITGGYAVSVIVRDITNGTIVYRGSNGLQIDAPATHIPESSGGSSASSKKSNDTENETGSSGMSAIITVGGIILMLLALAIGLYALLMWVKKKTTGKLVTTIENMEKSIVKADDKEVKPEPVKIKKEAPTSNTPAPSTEDISQREKGKTEFAGTSRDNVVPVNASGPVPSWLQKAGTTPATPNVQKNPTPITTTNETANAEEKKPLELQKPVPAPVPDWLKQAPKKAETTAPVKESVAKISEEKKITVATPAAAPVGQKQTSSTPPKPAADNANVKATTSKETEKPSVPMETKEVVPKTSPAPVQKTVSPPAVQPVQPKAAVIEPKKTDEPINENAQKVQQASAVPAPIPETKILPAQAPKALLQKPKTEISPAKQVVTSPQKKLEPRDIEKMETSTKKQKNPNNGKDGDRPIAIIKADSLTK